MKQILVLLLAILTCSSCTKLAVPGPDGKPQTIYRSYANQKYAKVDFENPNGIRLNYTGHDINHSEPIRAAGDAANKTSEGVGTILTKWFNGQALVKTVSGWFRNEDNKIAADVAKNRSNNTVRSRQITEQTKRAQINSNSQIREAELANEAAARNQDIQRQALQNQP